MIFCNIVQNMQEALLIKYYEEINKILGIFDIPLLFLQNRQENV